MKRRTKYVCTLGGAAVLALLIIWHQYFPPVTSDIPSFLPDGRWVIQAFLDVRVDSKSGNLLLRFELSDEDRTVFFEYGREERQLYPISEAIWDSADGVICSAHGCGAPYSPTGVTLARRDGALWHGSERLPVAGRTVIRTSYSPDGTLIAVVSADGWKRPSTKVGFWPWGGTWGGGYAGQHYVELFTTPDLMRVGKPIRIPLTTAEGMGSHVWTADGDYVVLTGSGGVPLYVIPTDIGKEG